MQPCSVCTSPRRAEIDQRLVERVPLRRIVAEQGGTISLPALHRHSRAHVAESLVKARDAGELAQADSLLARVEKLMNRSERIARAAEKARQWSPAVSALREVRCCLELLAELQGELQRTQNNVFVQFGVSSQEEAEHALREMLADLFSRNLTFGRSFAEKLLQEVEGRERELVAGN
jgi:hypothetical protein